MNLWIVLSQAAADPWGVSRMGQGRTEIVTPRACDDQSGETLDVLIGLPPVTSPRDGPSRHRGEH